MEYRLYYDTPAKKFAEALPIGNGSMGAMVYGNASDFHFSLNADTLWSGKACNQDHLIVSDKCMEEVRSLLHQNNYWEAQKLVQDTMLSERYNESYVSAGFLDIHLFDDAETKYYQRVLNLNTASVDTEYTNENRTVCAESFVSCSENALVTRITSDSAFQAEIRLSSLLKFLVKGKDDVLILQGEAPEHVEPNYVDCTNPVIYGNGMRFVISTMVHSTDGTVVLHDEFLSIQNATQCVILTTVETGYMGWDAPLLDNWRLLEDKCIESFAKAKKYDFKRLKERHEEIHRNLFDRVKIHIADKNEDRTSTPTNIRIHNAENETDTGLFELLFQYGRYLMICSSRPTGSFTQPANLQGIWCEDIRSVWSSNWTVNINTEMNYWLNGPCALSDCEIPLLQMIKEASISGEITAKETFHSDGWTACHNLDIWRQTTPVKGEVKWSYWPMGGVWLTTHLYTHYLYTNDKNYLQYHAWPIMKETAKFCLSRVREENGKVYTDFSTSPENTFLDQEGRECALCDSVTMDIILIREVLLACMETCRILNVDLEFAETLEKTVKKLPEYQTGAFGQLLEWNEEYKEADENHRHFAHLIGLHPFHQIDFDTRRELLEAAERVIEKRTCGMKYYIGWGEAWLCNFYARLRNGNEAKRHLQLFLNHCCYGNLLGLHPPLGESHGEREIFQIDGNFGVTAGIAEMLVQSKKGIIDLLPALPDEWQDGELSGVYTVGGHKLDLFWNHCRLEKMCLYAGSDENLAIRCSTHFVYRNKDGKILDSEFYGDGWKLMLEVKKKEEYWFM